MLCRVEWRVEREARAEDSCEVAAFWDDWLEAMAPRRAASLVWSSERRVRAVLHWRWQAASERLVSARVSSAFDAAAMASREACCSCSRALICVVSFSRVERAS